MQVSQIREGEERSSVDDLGVHAEDFGVIRSSLRDGPRFPITGRLETLYIRGTCATPEVASKGKQ